MRTVIAIWNFGAWSALLVGGPVIAIAYFATTIAAAKIMMET